MGSMLIYALETSVVLAVLYLGFKWLLASATFHRFNRMVLLAIYAVSLAVPFVIPAVSISAVNANMEIGLPTAVAVVSEPAVNIETTTYPIDWPLIMCTVYFAGCFLTFVVAAVSFAKMIRIIRKADKLEGYHNIFSSNLADGTFSWWRYIILAETDIDENIQKVIEHETVHTERMHWIDLAIGHMVMIFQWFNPASYLMLRELRNVHEYEVDEIVCANDPYSYQMMLIKKAAGSSFPTFADSLNSQIYNRITMMLSKKSNGQRRLAAAALLPLAAIAALGLSQPAVASMLDNLKSADIEREFTNFSDDVQISGFIDEAISSDNDSGVPAAESFAGKPVSITLPSETNTSENKAPEKKASSKSDENPTVFIDGKRMETKNLTNIDPNSIESIKIIKNDPEYPNGRMNITLKKGGSESSSEAMTPVKAKDSDVYLTVDKLAEYPGGVKALMQFLTENIKYPEGLKLENPVRVIVRFDIAKDGSVYNPVVLKSGGEECDKAAIDVVMKMPKWIPGEVNGEPVASRFNLPVMFKNTSPKEEVPQQSPAN